MRCFKYLVVAAMIFCVALTSCQKNDVNPMKLLEIISLKERELFDEFEIEYAEDKYEFEYDRRNRITGYAGYRYLDYNAAGDLVEHNLRYSMSRNPWSKTTFSRKGNKINFITTYYHPLGTLSGNVTGELELNAQGLPVKLTSENEQTQGMDCLQRNVWSYTVTLTWQNGNLIKVNWKRESESDRKCWWEEESKSEKSSNTGTVNYTHDDNKTPFYHCNTPKWALWWFNYCSWNGYNENYQGNNYGDNKNNIKTETREDGKTITYEYTYDNDGFPATRVWVSGTNTYMETYTYKHE